MANIRWGAIGIILFAAACQTVPDADPGATTGCAVDLAAAQASLAAAEERIADLEAQLAEAEAVADRLRGVRR